MRSFAYHMPATVPEAAALLAGDGESRPIAGGMTLLPTMKQRLATPSGLVSLASIPELGTIALAGGALTIGATATHDSVARSATVQDAIPALAALAGSIGDPQVRNRGTLGGSIANNDPNADYPAAVLGLAATIVTSRREIAADDFFLGLFETALAPDEIVTAVRFPVPLGAGYAKLRNPASRFPMVGVFVARSAAGVRVAVTGAAACVFRAATMEEALAKDFSPKAIERVRVDPSTLASDIHADAEYRAHLVTVMAKRAVEAAAA